MPSLFSKHRGDVTWEDLEAFVEATEEGPAVEYKREMIRGEALAKSISSIANARGGILIIGVHEDKDTREREITPIALDGEPDLAIENTSQKGIYPPIMPEVFHLAYPTASDQGVVFVRIDQSLLAPHFYAGRTKCRIRKGKSARPAEADEITALLRRREDAHEDRQAVLSRVLQQLGPWPAQDDDGHARPFLQITLSPSCVAGPTIPRQDLPDLLLATLGDGTRTGSRGVLQGFMLDYPGHESLVVTQEGLLLIRRALLLQPPVFRPVSPPPDYVEQAHLPMQHLRHSTDDFLAAASRCLTESTLWGMLHLTISLTHTKGLNIQDDMGRTGNHVREDQNIARDDHIARSWDLPSFEFTDRIHDMRDDFLATVGWAFNWTSS